SAVHGGDGLIAVLLRLLERLLACELAGSEFVLTLELELRAPLARDGRIKLRLSLINGRFLRGDLLFDAVDGCLLGGGIVFGSLHRELIVAVVDSRDHLTLANVRIVIELYRRHVA